jgi:hypothetical protein
MVVCNDQVRQVYFILDHQLRLVINYDTLFTVKKGS